MRLQLRRGPSYRAALQSSSGLWGVWDERQDDWTVFPTIGDVKLAHKEAARIVRERMPEHTFVSYREVDLFATWAERDKRYGLARKLRRGLITPAGIAVQLTASERTVVERYCSLGR